MGKIGGVAREIPGMRPGRIQALTDGVYAIAMTILVLGLKTPNAPHNSAALVKGLLDMQLQFTDLALSFFLLAVFWTIHHRHFQDIIRVDTKLLWLNMLSLLFVILIPFSTTLYTEYRTVTTAAIFFEANILLLGLLKFWHWSYAARNNRLVRPKLSHRAIYRGQILNLVTPCVSLAAIGLALIAPDSSTMLFLLVPVLIAGVRRVYPDNG